MNSRVVILASARALLMEHGYAGTTVSALRRHAGVGPGSLHHHFPRETPGQPGVGPRDRIVDEAVRGLLDTRMDRLLDVLADALQEDPSQDVLALLLRELHPGCPLVRCAADPGLSAQLRHRRRVGDALDRLVDFLSNLGLGATPTSGADSRGVSADRTGQAVALIAFALGFLTLESLYRSERDPRTEEERDLDVEILVLGGHETLKRRAATRAAIAELRRHFQ